MVLWHMYMCMKTWMSVMVCVVVRRLDGGGGGELGISRISEMVESSSKRLCSATGVPSAESVIHTDKSDKKYSFRMRSDRWMITVRVWWWWHSNLILR